MKIHTVIEDLNQSYNSLKFNLESKLDNFYKITENQQNLINSITYSNDNVRPKLNLFEKEINNLNDMIKKHDEYFKTNKNNTIDDLSEINSSKNIN